LNSSAELQTEALLADLITARVQPVIEKTLRSKLRVSFKTTDFSPTNQEALELAGDIKLLLINELRRLKSNPDGKVIYNLDGYVGTMTVNIYRQHLRSKYPQRQRLKSRLRYLLTHHHKFALWEREGVWVCGFRKDEKATEALDAQTIQAGIVETVNRNNLRDEANIIVLVAAVFDFAKSPVRFDDLLAAVARIQEIKEFREMPESEGFSVADGSAFSEDKVLTELELQSRLKTVWTEICALPVRHRAALLLNLKDRAGDPLVKLFPLLRIASIRKIAEILEFAPEEFAAVWNELPWDDLRIGEYLRLTRQQVINLRQSARARLARVLRE
jgi:hypothetical protein